MIDWNDDDGFAVIFVFIMICKVSFICKLREKEIFGVIIIEALRYAAGPLEFVRHFVEMRILVCRRVELSEIAFEFVRIEDMNFHGRGEILIFDRS